MKSLDGINDGAFACAFDAIKAIQDELMPYGIEATWTYIWEVKTVRVKLWYSIHNEHRSIEIWLTENDFRNGVAFLKLKEKVAAITRDVSDQRYLAEKSVKR